MALLIVKWSLGIFVICGGAIFCWRAYAGQGAATQFRVVDLFRHRPVGEKPNTQLIIEGVFSILVGIGGLIWL